MIQSAILLSKPRIESQNILPMRHVLVRDLVLMARIGVFDHEKQGSQWVRINLDLAVQENPTPLEDDLSNVVCYNQIIRAIRTLVDGGHNQLIETLGEHISNLCLSDPRVRRAIVTVEKLDVYTDVAAVGIAITRENPVS
jgi:dihydroneopterin aldolase